MKRILLLSFMSLTVAFAAIAQRTVSGKITSAEDGDGIPGVNVVLKGTTTGTTTDLDGNYRLSVPEEGGTLIYSFIGLLAQETEIGARSVIDIGMAADVTELTEVIVTAFGVERAEKSLGYSVQELDGDQLTEARETNIVNSLSGQIAGVQVTNGSGNVGSSSRIVLRGPSSLTGENQPLFVVDGIPINNTNYGNSSAFGGADFPNGAADINPDDIATISVLKGANAAALYGSRAANGVILITTKKGSKTKGIGVSINSNVTFQTPLRIPDYQNSYGGGYNPNSYEWLDGTSGSGGEDESWGPALDQGLAFKQWQDTDGGTSPWVSNPDNIRDFYELGTTTSNNVALSGGNDVANFRLSYTNMQQDGMIYNTGLERNTFALSSGVKLSDKLSADASVNYIKSSSDNISGGGYDNNNPMQQFTWFQRQVDVSALKDYKNLPLNAEGTSAQFTPLTWNTNFNNNPYWVLDNNTQGFEKNRIIGNVKINYQLTDWLSLFVRTGTDFFTDLQTIKRGHNSNDYPNGYYREIDRSWQESNSDFALTFNKDITPDFGLTVTAGGNLRREVYSRNILTANELEIPGTYTIANSSVAVVATNYDQQREMQSLYGMAQFQFRNYLFIDLTARNDWSSTLPLENNSFFYPSASLSLILTDLADIQSNVLSFAKVRGSWAQVGSDTDAYRLQDVFTLRSPKWNGTTTVTQATVGNQLKNPLLKPEITTSVEFGVDLRFFSDRLGLQATYFDATSTDLIVEIDVSGASGWRTQFANVGEMNNKGIELQMNATPVEIGDFKWEMNLNYARIRNEVVTLGGVDNLVLGGQWNVDVIATPGESYPALFGPDYQRDDAGNIIHVNGLPQKDNTSKVLGSAFPDWTGGFTNTFSFKGVSLGVLIDAKMGGSVYSMTNAWGRYSGVLEETLIGREVGIVGAGVQANGVDENGNTQYVPNNVPVDVQTYNHSAFGNNIAAGSVFDASYVKLRQVILGYTIPKQWLGASPFQSISVSVVGRNLALLYSKVPHIDPETAFSNDNAQGIEHASYSSARSLGFNVNLKF
ncbi:MAG: TonB-linked SusC/RagA family outer membrane protein [Cyclobacteriaceae bacterium]|jgi:TonB-linked SusC/RagA family outer membrane protein